jgi:outer membrane biosynthesis protein TonB
VLASIFVHLLIGLSLAAFGRAPRDLTVAEEEPPPQLTIEPLAEPKPSPPKNAPMTTVDESKKSEVAPEEKTFEANENSIAAAEKAPTTDSFLPGQDGKDRPFMNLEDHDYSLATNGATPQPTTAPTPEEKPTPEETPTPHETPAMTETPATDQFALLTQTPSPAPSPAQTEEQQEVPTPTPTPTPELTATPPSPSSAYRDLQQKTHIQGGISNRGPAAVNAVGTPLGKYVKQLQDAIGARWYYLIKRNADLSSVGTTTLRFDVEPDGHIENLQVVNNTTTEACASIAIRSIQETKFPPLSADLVAELPGGHLTMDEMVFAIFPNR